MPPSRHARRNGISFHTTPETDFKKQRQIFAIHGKSHPHLILRNGEIVVNGDWYLITDSLNWSFANLSYSVEVDAGEDYSNTSAPDEPWIAEVLDVKGDKRDTPRDEASYYLVVLSSSGLPIVSAVCQNSMVLHPVQ
jgi:hypothetical protein